MDDGRSTRHAQRVRPARLSAVMFRLLYVQRFYRMNVVIRKEAVMKYGMRKPSWKKSLSARTKGRATRAVKRALIPGYGKKGMGWLHPKRKLYNTVYKKTTFSLFDLFK